jgi:hypothetical protein
MTINKLLASFSPNRSPRAPVYGLAWQCAIPTSQAALARQFDSNYLTTELAQALIPAAGR